MEQRLVDVSEWNGYVDWQAVKDAGYHAIIRCGYGSDYANQDDKQWERNVSECERLGIPYGVYLYSYATDEAHAVSEAQHVLRLIEGHRLSYPIYLDVEEPGYDGYARRACEVFGDILEAEGYWVGVYSMKNWWDNCLAGLERFTKWVACWGTSSPGMDCDMWQYSSDGWVPGVDGRCDVNICWRDFPGIITGDGNDPGVPVPDVPWYTAEDLACQVLAGMWGNGDDRRMSLGERYDEVQGLVNRWFSGNPDTNALARAVIDGLFGNGEERKQKLGGLYEATQRRVNQLLS